MDDGVDIALASAMPGVLQKRNTCKSLNTC